MNRCKFKVIWKLPIFISVIIFMGFTSCRNTETDPNATSVFDSDDTSEAVSLIEDANKNLKSIRTLYHENNPKVAELKQALQNRDTEKVKKLTDQLSLTINDGYVLATNAKQKISDAQDLNINPDWKDYLRLKESSLDMQIKAFDFRRESAILFRNKFGGDDKLQLSQAAAKFKQNEESFEKYMVEAQKLMDQANKLYKEVENRGKS